MKTLWIVLPFVLVASTIIYTFIDFLNAVSFYAADDPDYYQGLLSVHFFFGFIILMAMNICVLIFVFPILAIRIKIFKHEISETICLFRSTIIVLLFIFYPLGQY